MASVSDSDAYEGKSALYEKKPTNRSCPWGWNSDLYTDSKTGHDLCRVPYDHLLVDLNRVVYGSWTGFYGIDFRKRKRPSSRTGAHAGRDGRIAYAAWRRSVPRIRSNS